MFRSLRLTLVISHTAIIILTNVALATIFYYAMTRSLQSAYGDYLEFVAEHGKQNILQQVEIKSDELVRIAEGKEVMDYLKTYRDPALTAYLTNFNNDFPVLSFINRFGEEEVKTVEGEASDDLMSYPDSLLLRKALSHPNTVVVGQEEGLQIDNIPTIQLAIAKYRYFGDEFAGLLLARIPLTRLARSLADIRIGEGGFLVLTDDQGKGIIISRSKQGSQELIHAGGSPPPLLPDGEIPLSRTRVLGVDALVSRGALPSLEWTLTAVLPYEEFSSKIMKVRTGVIIFSLFFFCITLAIAFMLAAGITSPLARLTQAAQAISRGRNCDTIEIKSRDEIGTLVQSFNIMCANLQKTMVSRDYFNTILSSMKESLIVTTPDGTIETVNGATCRMLGYEAGMLIGQPLDLVLKKRDRDLRPHSGDMEALNRIDNSEQIYATRDGRHIPVLFSAAPMRNMKGEAYGMVCVAMDIGERKEMEEALRTSEAKLRALAITDELTNLLNRRGFMTLAEQQLLRARRSEEGIFLMYADVDNLKWVNDNLGHQMGDLVIQESSAILRRTFRDSDIVARLGGDEFAVLLVDASDEKYIVSRLEEAIRRANEERRHPFTLSMSIGIVRFDPRRPCSLEDLMSRADTLMYESKNRKKETAAPKNGQPVD